MTMSVVTMDRRGRILLAGCLANDPPNRSRFVLARLKSTGQIDRSFGHGGSVRTGFGSLAFAEPTKILVDGAGRILVGGVIYQSPDLASGNGVGMARYLGGG
jgi:hypothetical protein